MRMEKTRETASRQTVPADKTRIDTKHIDVLDGVRALAVFGVLWFHFWQQNWIMPYIDVPLLTKIGLPGSISLLFLPRAGFLFVDWLLFLSAFCLFLPYARAALDQTPLPETRLFYQKRVARIVPSYVVSHIDSTRALDGQQVDEWDGISARWTFHPESGLHLVLRET